MHKECVGRSWGSLLGCSLALVIANLSAAYAHQTGHSLASANTNPQISSTRQSSDASYQSTVIANVKPVVRALQINADNAASLIRHGPDATGGIGDWFISNGTLCAIISDVNHEHEFSTKGGVLVDLGFCDRHDDHYSSSQDLIDSKVSRPLDAESISAEASSNSATITVQSSTPGATQTATYTLSVDAPTELHIAKRITKTPEPDTDFNVFATLNFNLRSLEPFVFSSSDWANTNGFANEDFVSRGIDAITAAARPADTIISISPPTAIDPIAYGWHLKSARRVNGDESYELPSFVLADEESNAMLILTDTFYIGDGRSLGWLQLPQIPLLTLSDNAQLAVEEVIYVGKSGSVASVTDQIFKSTHPETQRVFGVVSEHNVALHIDQADGTPLTHIRPETDGSFELQLPPGDYRLRQLGSANRSTLEPFSVSEAELALKPKQLAKAATLNLPQGDAMRLVFIGLNGTPNPNFVDTLTDSSVNDDSGRHYQKPVSQVFLSGLEGDLRSVTLSPGDYRVYATRGPEYSLEQTLITLETGDVKDLKIELPSQQLTTPKHIASDLHVHSGASFDNAFSDAERVRTFVAEHGEVMVSSEHDVPVDFTPIIQKMGARDKIVAIAAAEVTSLLQTELNPFTGGHSNFFPYPPEPLEYRRGMINHEDMRMRDIIHAVREKHPDVIVQLNHPRLNLELSGDLPEDYQTLINNGEFLEHMGSAGYPYNPNKTLTTEPNNVLIEKHPKTGLRDIDFDLIELINPGGEHHEARIQAVRKDWLSFLKQGERIVATANSDSHSSAAQVGLPRTMVAVSNDKVSEFDQAEFITSLKSGNAYGTTGPMLEVSLSGKQMGETFKGPRGQLSIKISSTDWIKTNKATIQINGETIGEYPLKDQPVNTLLIPVAFSKDSFVTIEVSGPATEDYSAVYTGLKPYAYSNPIYVDFNSDGLWEAPGL